MFAKFNLIGYSQLILNFPSGPSGLFTAGPDRYFYSIFYLKSRFVMLIMKLIGKTLKALRDGATPGQIAGGFTLGLALGLFPGWPLQVLALFFLIRLLNVNIAISILGAIIS